jgi:hypothetical protein
MPSLPPTLASCMPRTRLLVQAGRVEDAVRWALVEEGGHWEAALALLRRLEAEESYRVGGAALNSGSLADKAGGSVMTASHSVLLGRPSPIRCLAVFYEVGRPVPYCGLCPIIGPNVGAGAVETSLGVPVSIV